MREDALQYHRRVVSEFADALINKIDARDEAVNVLLSSNNLRNYGFAQDMFRKEAEDYLLKPKLELKKPTAQGMSRIFSAKTTRQEATPRRHHVSRPLFSDERWVRAMEYADEDEIDRMVRMAIGFSFDDTIPNLKERGTDIVGPHSKFKALNLRSPRKGETSYGEKPLWQQLTMFLFGNGGKNAQRLHDAMVKTAKKLHPRLKSNNHFGDWIGNNATMMKFYQRGKDEFLNYITSPQNKQFGPNHPFVTQNPFIDEHYMRVKFWENEGIPRDEILKILYDEKGAPIRSGKDSSPVDKLRSMADTYRDRFRRPKEGEANFGRVGDDAYRLGIAMLPFDEIYQIQRWMMETGGGVNEDGEIDDRVIKKILGPDARGYMAHHAYLMDNMLNTLHAGGSERNGMNHVLPNRFTNQGQVEVEKNIAERQEEFREKLQGNSWSSLTEETLGGALDGYDLTSKIQRFAQKHDAEIVADDYDEIYPHIHNGPYGTMVFMSSELPDIKNLVNNGFFEKEELDDLIERCVKAHSDKDFTDLLRQTVSDYTHTHNVDDEFDMTKEPDIRQTPLGIVMEGVGSRRGNANGESGDFNSAYHEAMPNMFFAPLPTRAFMFPKRGEREGGGKSKTQEQINEFDPSKDVDGQIRLDLVRTMKEYETQDQDEKLRAFDEGKVVNLEVPRKDLVSEEVADRYINPDTKDEREEAGESPYARIDEYTKDMPSPMTPATKGLNSFYMAHSNPLQLDMEDLTGFLSLDGLPLQNTETALKTPMYSTRKARIGSQSNGRRMLFDRMQLPGDHKNHDARQFGITKNNLSHEDKMLIDALLLGAHHPLHEHDDASLELFQTLLNTDRGNRLNMIKNGLHKDVLGHGRTGNDMLNEIIHGVEAPTHHAIYRQEDFDEHMDKLLNFNSRYQLPEAQTKGIRSRARLIQAIKERDHRYQQAMESGDVNLKAQLDEEIREAVINGGPVGMMYDEDTNTMSSIIVGPSPSYLASHHQAALKQALQFARQNGREDAQEIIEKRLMEVRQAAPPQNGEEVQLKNHEERLGNHVDTLRAITQIYKALQPAIEKIYPGIFSKENREAHAATAYTLKLAEQIAMLSPDERRKLFTNKFDKNGQPVGIVLGGRGFNFDLSDQEIEALANISVKRDTHRDSSYAAQEMLESQFGNVQPKGYTMMSHLAKTSSNIKDEDVASFDQLIKNIQQAATQQNITFGQAFKARYYPTTTEGINVRGQDRKNLFDDIEGMKKGGGFQYNDGGVFHESGLRSGGQSILDAKGKPLSMRKEREILFNILQSVFEQTREGSDVAIDTKMLQMFKGKAPKIKTVMDFNKINTLERMASILTNETGMRVFDKSGSESMDTPLGGYDQRNAPVVPILTSVDKKFHKGQSTPVPFIHRPDRLQDGVLHLEDQENHTYNPPSVQQLFAPRNLMRSVNSSLQPLEPAKRGDVYFPNYKTFDNEPNPNTRFGQAANQAMLMGTEDLQSTDESLRTYSSHILDVALDDTLLIKEDGKPQPVKFMHRIFDLEDMKHLRGFTGDWVISLYPQGEHVIVSKDKKGMTAYGIDGEVKLDEAIMEESDKVYEKDFTVHAILHDGMMTVIDLLKTADEDTHNMPTKDRIRHLRAQYESSEHIKMPEPINTKRSDDEGLQVAIDGLRKENDIDILLRDANATYMKGEPRHPKWVLLTKEKMVDVVIISASGTTYGIGVGPLMHPEHYGKRAQQVGEEHYMNVGSAKGPRGLKVGDFATVRCTGVSASKKEHPVYRLRSAKITDNEPFAADSVESLAIMSGEHHVPQQVSMKKGNITIHFPAFDDEVICKTRKEDGVWFVEPQSSVWGNEYLVELARDQEAYWITKAAWLLKQKDTEEPEYDEVTPEAPAGHTKKPKKVLDEEEEVIKRGLDLIERGLEHLVKEKITSTGVQGLGIGYATPDESPRGPTQNIRDNTMPDFDPQARSDDEEKPATSKKTKRLRTSEGEVATLEDNGVIAIENSSLDIP